MADISPVPKNEDKVDVEVMTSRHLNDALQARREWIEEQIRILNVEEDDFEDIYYRGYREALNWLEKSVDVWEFKVPVEILPKEIREE